MKKQYPPELFFKIKQMLSDGIIPLNDIFYVFIY